MDVYNGDYIATEGKKQGWPEEFLRKNEETTEAQRQGFTKAYRASVPIVFGTDSAVYPHGNNAKQFHVMVNRGMKPMDAIRAATSVAALYMGREDGVGALEEGRLGDFIAVEGDPLEDITVLERVRVVGLEFPPSVNELEKARLTALPSKVVKPPRIGQCRSHFECKVEWTKQWLHRVMVVGKVVAASVDEGCVDADGYLVWDKLKPAHYCGHEYKNGFVAAYQKMDVDMIYTEPIAPRSVSR